MRVIEEKTYRRHEHPIVVVSTVPSQSLKKAEVYQLINDLQQAIARVEDFEAQNYRPSVGDIVRLSGHEFVVKVLGYDISTNYIKGMICRCGSECNLNADKIELVRAAK